MLLNIFFFGKYNVYFALPLLIIPIGPFLYHRATAANGKCNSLSILYCQSIHPINTSSVNSLPAICLVFSPWFTNQFSSPWTILCLNPSPESWNPRYILSIQWPLINFPVHCLHCLQDILCLLQSVPDVSLVFWSMYWIERRTTIYNKFCFRLEFLKRMNYVTWV